MKVSTSYPPGEGGNILHYAKRKLLLFEHRHDELEFDLVVRGSGEYIVDDVRRTIRQGDLAWLRPDQEHVLVKRSDDFEAWIVHVGQAVWSEARFNRSGLGASGAPFQVRRLGQEREVRLARLCQEIADCPAAARRDGIALLLALALGWSAEAEQPHGRHPAVALALELLRGAPGDPSPAALAHRAKVSERHLARLFHAEVGEPLRLWRQRRCLERAQAILRDDPHRDMAKVAVAAGFSSYLQFHRWCRRLSGRTPGQMAGDDVQH